MIILPDIYEYFKSHGFKFNNRISKNKLVNIGFPVSQILKKFSLVSIQLKKFPPQMLYFRSHAKYKYWEAP